MALFGGATMASRILFCLAVLAAAGAGVLDVIVCAWYLSLRFSSLDALWQFPVLLCYPLWLLATLAVVFTYLSDRTFLRQMLIISCIESSLAGFVWIAVSNYWVTGR